MTDYRKVSEALAAGTSPAELCETCPWDRYCIVAPSMTAADVDAKIKEAEVKDKAREAKMTAAEKAKGGGAMPITMLLNMVAYSGEDMKAYVCPVFALRLRSRHGRGIVDGLKDTMRGWQQDG